MTRAHQASAIPLVESDPPANSPFNIFPANLEAFSQRENPMKKRARRRVHKSF